MSNCPECGASVMQLCNRGCPNRLNRSVNAPECHDTLHHHCALNPFCVGECKNDQRPKAMTPEQSQAAEVAEIERRHERYCSWGMGNISHACELAHQDRATLLSIIKSRTQAAGDEVTREDVAAELERLWLDGWRLDTKEGRAKIAYHVEDLHAPKESVK